MHVCVLTSAYTDIAVTYITNHVRQHDTAYGSGDERHSAI
jgi:hypothetical protein